MAHLVLEVTPKLLDGMDPIGLLKELNGALDGVAGLRCADIKSRLIPLDFFAIGLSHADDMQFAAVELQTFEGKTQDQIDEITTRILVVLDDAFSVGSATLGIDISVRVTELSKSGYGRLRSSSWPQRTH